MFNNRVIVFDLVILLRGGAVVPPWYREMIFDSEATGFVYEIQFIYLAH